MNFLIKDIVNKFIINFLKLLIKLNFKNLSQYFFSQKNKDPSDIKSIF